MLRSTRELNGAGLSQFWPHGSQILINQRVIIETWDAEKRIAESLWSARNRRIPPPDLGAEPATSPAVLIACRRYLLAPRYTRSVGRSSAHSQSRAGLLLWTIPSSTLGSFSWKPLRGFRPSAPIRNCRARRDLPFWLELRDDRGRHVEELIAQFNVRFRALFGHQRVARLTDANKKSPSGMSPRGVFLRGNDIVRDLSKLDSRLICSASDNELGGVDDGKALGIVTALEIKRLVLGGVNMRDLSRV